MDYCKNISINILHEYMNKFAYDFLVIMKE